MRQSQSRQTHQISQIIAVIIFPGEKKWEAGIKGGWVDDQCFMICLFDSAGKNPNIIAQM